MRKRPGFQSPTCVHPHLFRCSVFCFLPVFQRL
jgi:hypothetical protein